MSLKPLAEQALCSIGGTRVARRRRAGRTIVLAYHNIVPHGQLVLGDQSLHLRQHDFASQLDQLTVTHEIVPLAQLSATPGTDRPRAVITFDDAYSGALTAGVAELVKRRLPATVFVAPAFVGRSSFWWDRLAASGLLTNEARDRVLQQLAGKDEAVHDPNSERVALPDHHLAASESELEAAHATGLITFGSHSWSHPNLTALNKAEIARELSQSMEWLKARYASTLAWISYPYGLSSETVESVVRSLGYEGGFLISGGFTSSAQLSAQPFALPRLNVPAGVSLRGFELRTSGLLNR